MRDFSTLFKKSRKFLSFFFFWAICCLNALFGSSVLGWVLASARNDNQDHDNNYHQNCCSDGESDNEGRVIGGHVLSLSSVLDLFFSICVVTTASAESTESSDTVGWSVRNWGTVRSWYTISLNRAVGLWWAIITRRSSVSWSWCSWSWCNNVSVSWWGDLERWTSRCRTRCRSRCGARCRTRNYRSSRWSGRS